MSQDAVVRLRLDTSGAKNDLASLYSDMRHAPAIRVPGAASDGGIGGGGGGGPGYGGFSVRNLLGGLLNVSPLAIPGMLAYPSIRDAGSVVHAVAGGGGEWLSGTLGLAGYSGKLSGGKRAAAETARLLGAAYGHGGVGMGEVTSLYDSLRTVYEPESRGEAEIKARLGGEQAVDVLEDLVNVLKDAIRAVSRFGGPPV